MTYQEPAWKAEKAALDAADDGCGPYLDWYFGPSEDRGFKQQCWRDFLVWANDHLGQGYSVACVDGDIADPVTHWCFKGYMAGRRALPRPISVRRRMSIAEAGQKAMQAMKFWL